MIADYEAAGEGANEFMPYGLTFKHKHLRFEFFMLPFRDVDFRAWFQEELTGRK